MMTIPQDLLPALQERLTALGYPPDYPLYRVTTADFLTVLAPRLTQTPVLLNDADLEAMLDQVTSYLNGEGMPWHAVVSLGIDDGWPEQIIHSQKGGFPHAAHQQSA